MGISKTTSRMPDINDVCAFARASWVGFRETRNCFSAMIWFTDCSMKAMGDLVGIKMSYDDVSTTDDSNDDSVLQTELRSFSTSRNGFKAIRH